MSAFMINNKNLSIITNQIIRDDINGHRIPASLKRIIYGKKGYELFNMLSDMNEKAVSSRYKAHVDTERRYFPDEELYKDSVYGDISHWMYSYIKILDSYIYQCTEDETVDWDLFEALEEYRNNWYSYLITNSQEYQNA